MPSLQSDFDVPDWVCWLAQDQNGAWWGYSAEPLRNDTGWYENEVGDYIRLAVTESHNWKSSLTRIK